METPVLSKKQQRKSLSAKKQPPKSIRAILQTPREDYRPVITVEESKEIIHLIKSTFGTCQNKPVQKIPWSLIKNIPKTERKEFRQKYHEEHGDVDKNSLTKTHKCFVLGFNATTRLLEKDMLEALLLESDIGQSNVMSNYVLRLCKLNKTPVLLVPDLRNSVNNTSLKIPTIALGFKKIQCCDLFKPLIDKIKEFSNLYLKIHSKEKLKNVTPMEVDQVSDVIPYNQPKESTDTVKKFKDLYLYRDVNTKSRIFVPKSSENKEKIEENIRNDTDDFISLNINSTADSSCVSEYRPMTVKKITGNVNRKMKRKK